MMIDLWLAGYSSYMNYHIDFWLHLLQQQLFYRKKKNNFWRILHEVQELANLYYMSCIARMDLLILD